LSIEHPLRVSDAVITALLFLSTSSTYPLYFPSFAAQIECWNALQLGGDKEQQKHDQTARCADVFCYHILRRRQGKIEPVRSFLSVSDDLSTAGLTLESLSNGKSKGLWPQHHLDENQIALPANAALKNR
jgi:hypothetical protein